MNAQTPAQTTSPSTEPHGSLDVHTRGTRRALGGGAGADHHPQALHGPPSSANDGYGCGVLAQRLGGPAEVTPRAPLPAGAPLSVRPESEVMRLFDGDMLIAEARASHPRVTTPERRPMLVAAAQASALGRELWTRDHPFPTCLVCEPDRAEGDALRIEGPVAPEEPHLVASWRLGREGPSGTQPLLRSSLPRGSCAQSRGRCGSICGGGSEHVAKEGKPL